MDEANRFIDRMYQVLFRDEGQRAAPMPQPEPAKEVADDADEKLDLDAYDEDDPNRKNLEVLLKRQSKLEARNKELEERTRRDEQQSRDYAARQATQELLRSLSRLSPELFGTEKEQSQRQLRHCAEAVDMAMFLSGRLAERGIPLPSHEAMAEQVLRKAFSDEVAKTKTVAKRQAVEKRQALRSVAAPARAASGKFTTSTDVFEGPMEDDPDLLNAVKSVQDRYR